MSTVQVGDKLVLDKMYFMGGRHYLKQESIPILDELLKILLSNPSLKIEIQGHVCFQYDDEGDGIDIDTRIRNLSVARAKGIYDFLIENGIDKSRLSYKGFAATQILPGTNINDSKNRRVEILIIDK